MKTRETTYFTHKEIRGSVEWSEPSAEYSFYGQLQIDDADIRYEAQTLAELNRLFEQAVETYLKSRENEV